VTGTWDARMEAEVFTGRAPWLVLLCQYAAGQQRVRIARTDRDCGGLPDVVQEL
jgi:hypothetical protein